MDSPARQHGGWDLSDIVGDPSARSVVSFWPKGDHLDLLEECDGHYEASLTREQVGRLIVWLQARYDEMG